MNDASWALKLREVYDLITQQWDDFEFGSKTKGLAVELCKRDGCVDPNRIVMGYEGNFHPVTMGKKKMPIISIPLRPAWTHYVEEARELLEICEGLEQ